MGPRRWRCAQRTPPTQCDPIHHESASGRFRAFGPPLIAALISIDWSIRDPHPHPRRPAKAGAQRSRSNAPCRNDTPSRDIPPPSCPRRRPTAGATQAATAPQSHRTLAEGPCRSAGRPDRILPCPHHPHIEAEREAPNLRSTHPIDKAPHPASGDLLPHATRGKHRQPSIRETFGK